MRVGTHNTRAYSHSCTQLTHGATTGTSGTDRQACKDAGDCNLHVKVIQHQYQVSEGAKGQSVSMPTKFFIMYNSNNSFLHSSVNFKQV